VLDAHVLHLERLGLLCRDFGGIDVAKYSSLNLLAMCGTLPPAPGSVVCVGDKLAGCSNIHITAAGDTCDSIEASLGVIVGGTLKCSALQPDIPVCVRPGVNQVSVKHHPTSCQPLHSAACSCLGRVESLL
jgi:hypothetical protein